jgi:hypothetical protein
MAGKEEDKHFVGIIEKKFNDNFHSYNYCRMNIKTRGASVYQHIEILTESIAIDFIRGKLTQGITYEPPKENEGDKREKIKYHKFSVLEQDRFEKGLLTLI